MYLYLQIKNKMKKFLLLAVFACSISAAGFAQQDPQTKVKPTSTATQKVHNTFSKHKHYSGVKVKSESHGVKHKGKLNAKKGEVKIK